ncbi:hypothetical protein BD779DRAFT_158668 [Infundibulicybe gibba]|nr:hypothetical protein BD779DRAFT_158668 [Infundibulicybe gibba]
MLLRGRRGYSKRFASPTFTRGRGILNSSASKAGATSINAWSDAPLGPHPANAPIPKPITNDLMSSANIPFRSHNLPSHPPCPIALGLRTLTGTSPKPLILDYSHLLAPYLLCPAKNAPEPPKLPFSASPARFTIVFAPGRVSSRRSPPGHDSVIPRSHPHRKTRPKCPRCRIRRRA